jgi:hypothetical protein
VPTPQPVRAQATSAIRAPALHHSMSPWPPPSLTRSQLSHPMTHAPTHAAAWTCRAPEHRPSTAASPSSPPASRRRLMGTPLRAAQEAGPYGGLP